MPQVTGMRVRIALRYQPFAHALMPSVPGRPPLDLGGLGVPTAAVCPARARGVALVRVNPGWTDLRYTPGRGLGPEDAGEQGPPGAGVRLGEDGLEMILDRVLGHEHQLGDVPSRRAGDDMAQQLGLAGTQPAGPGEQREAPAGGGGLDADGDVALGDRLGGVPPVGAQGQPLAAAQVDAGERRVASTPASRASSCAPTL
jgi:hypothetical protein